MISELATGEGAQHAAAPARVNRTFRLWRDVLDWHAARRQRRLLYGIEPRLLLDMGIDPAEIYDSFHGSPGEVHGDRFRGLLPAARFRGAK